MKFSELKPCDACGKGLGLFFYRVQIEQHGVNVAEMRKRHAMDVMFPGAPGLAATFHGDSDDGTIKIQTRTQLLCQPCFLDMPAIAVAFEGDNEEDGEGGGA